MNSALKPSHRRRLGSGLLVSPALLFFVVFFAVPLVWCLVVSFETPEPLVGGATRATLENYRRFLTDGYYLKGLLWRTVRLSLVATVFAVVIGYIGALVVNRAPERRQPALMFLVMCPLWVNLVVRTLSLMVLLARDGPVNKLLLWLGLADRPAQLLYNETAVLIGMIQVSVPFVVISLHGVLKALRRDLEHAAMTVGANPLQAFLRVTLPLSVPGIMAGSILALGLNMESFVVPILLGGGRVHVMSVEAYETATIGNNLPFAAAIGMILLVITLLILALYQYIVRTMGRVSGSFQAG
jgi:putative spermidine/putrescine transport system permease protein